MYLGTLLFVAEYTNVSCTFLCKFKYKRIHPPLQLCKLSLDFVESWSRSTEILLQGLQNTNLRKSSEMKVVTGCNHDCITPPVHTSYLARFGKAWSRKSVSKPVPDRIYGEETKRQDERRPDNRASQPGFIGTSANSPFKRHNKATNWRKPMKRKVGNVGIDSIILCSNRIKREFTDISWDVFLFFHAGHSLQRPFFRGEVPEQLDKRVWERIQINVELALWFRRV